MKVASDSKKKKKKGTTAKPLRNRGATHTHTHTHAAPIKLAKPPSMRKEFSGRQFVESC